MYTYKGNKQVISVVAIIVSVIAISSCLIYAIQEDIGTIGEVDNSSNSTASEAVDNFIQNAARGNLTVEQFYQERINAITAAYGDDAWSNATFTEIEGGIPPFVEEVYIDKASNTEISESVYINGIERFKKELCAAYKYDEKYLDLQGPELQKLSADQMTTRLEIMARINSEAPYSVNTRATCKYQYFMLRFGGKDTSGVNGICNVRVLFVSFDGNWGFYSISFNIDTPDSPESDV